MSKVGEVQEHLDEVSTRGRGLSEQMEAMREEIQRRIEDVEAIGGREEGVMLDALERARAACSSAEEALAHMSQAAVSYMESL